MSKFFQFNGSLFVPSSWALPDTVAGGDAGKVITRMPGAVSFQTAVNDVLLYRNASTTLGVATPWMAQWFSAGGFATIADAGYAVALRNGTLCWLRAFHGLPVAASEVVTYVVVVNGADTALAVSLNVNSAGPATNTTNTVAVVAGDLLSMRCDGLTATRAARMGVDFFLQ